MWVPLFTCARVLCHGQCTYIDVLLDRVEGSELLLLLVVVDRSHHHHNHNRTENRRPLNPPRALVCCSVVRLLGFEYRSVYGQQAEQSRQTR